MISYIVFSLSDLIEELGEQDVQNILSSFVCKTDEDLETFISEKAIPYERDEKGKTFLLIDSEEFEQNKVFKIIAYYTLATTAIELVHMSDNKKKKIVGNFPNRSRRDSFPAFLIGQLGRDDRYSHDDISGEEILNEAYSTLKNAAIVVGGKLVVLECKPHMFDKVYQTLGYHKLIDELNEHGYYMLYKRIDFSEW